MANLSSTRDLPVYFGVRMDSPFLPECLVLTSSVYSFISGRSDTFFTTFLVSSDSIFVGSSFHFLVYFKAGGCLPLGGESGCIGAYNAALVFTGDLGPDGRSLDFWHYSVHLHLVRVSFNATTHGKASLGFRLPHFRP